MPAIEIRPTIASDLPRLMGIDHAITSEYVWQLELHRESGMISVMFREVRLPRAVTVNYPHNPFALADEWTRKAAVFTVLARNDPVGYLCLEEHPASMAWITDLVVAPAWRRRGLASALLEVARGWAREHAQRQLFLEMQSKNQAAIHLAQKHGYAFCGYNDHYYVTQDVALFFSKALK